jgi:hypothetical protein
MSRLEIEQCKSIAQVVEACLVEKKMTRKELIRPGLSKSTLENFFSGNASAKTVKKIELTLNRRLLNNDGHRADLDHGAYSRDEANEHEGIFLIFRPYFTADRIRAYKMNISWSDLHNCLIFEELNRTDKAYTHQGEVYISKDHPFMNLLTIEEGNIRNIILSFPSHKSDPFYRGIVTGLSKPSSLAWIPASTPVAMRRLQDHEIVPLGDFMPDDKPYEEYKPILTSITGNYALFRLP